jgi:hypothetical protein
MPADGILKNNVTMKFLMDSPLCMDGESLLLKKSSAVHQHIRISSVFFMKILNTAFKSNRKQIVFS